MSHYRTDSDMSSAEEDMMYGGGTWQEVLVDRLWSIRAHRPKGLFGVITPYTLVFARADMPRLLRQAQVADKDNAALLVALFGGDRAACLSYVLGEWDRYHPIGLCSVAIRGEDGQGQPAIVGLWVGPHNRRSAKGGTGDLAALLLHDAVQLVDPAKGLVRVDCVTHAGAAVVRRLPVAVQARLDVRLVMVDERT